MSAELTDQLRGLADIIDGLEATDLGIEIQHARLDGVAVDGNLLRATMDVLVPIEAGPTAADFEAIAFVDEDEEWETAADLKADEPVVDLAEETGEADKYPEPPELADEPSGPNHRKVMTTRPTRTTSTDDTDRPDWLARDADEIVADTGSLSRTLEEVLDVAENAETMIDVNLRLGCELVTAKDLLWELGLRQQSPDTKLIEEPELSERIETLREIYVAEEVAA